MRLYDTVLFDLDGTLLNTLDDIADSVNVTMASMGFPAVSVQDVRNFVGNGAVRLIERCIPDGIRNPQFNETVEFYKKHYAKNAMNQTKPYPGISELLKELSQRGCKIGIVSNKNDAVVNQLNVIYFGDYSFKAMGKREGIRKKPAPDSVFQILKELGSTVDRALYIGDSEVDLETARNAGMKSILVAWGFRDREILLEYGAEIIVDRPLDILHYLA